MLYRRSLCGTDLDVSKVSKHHTPLTLFSTPENSGEFDGNTIRSGNGPARQGGSKRQKQGFLCFDTDAGAALAARRAFGSQPLLTDLAKFPALVRLLACGCVRSLAVTRGCGQEAHRRVMRLEKSLCATLKLGATLGGVRAPVCPARTARADLAVTGG